MFLALVFLLSACTQTSTSGVQDMEALDEMSLDELSKIEEKVPEKLETSEPLTLKTKKGLTIILNNFAERKTIESPLKISGKAPRRWFFEGVFPVSLMTLDDESIAQWHVTGDWLRPLEGEENYSFDDMIDFATVLDFEPPKGQDLGKLVLEADNASGLPEHDDSVEVMILWPSKN